ncbi:MAG: sigma-70 family RNA polymerase sigma factor [Candidatus Eremiobacteraeota bacterium]|nr:sigma-70 family RNA polymerase sigma factor [Candidatus Eremiobacteraeota bacterium]MBC5828429.1 sigma-70 family RNA polymerase sigma factor [Candidatus Eremiobacteraeota bacterium]
MTLPPFQKLVDAHWAEVARLCHALSWADEADDAAQRAWLLALRAYPKIRHGANLRGWLLTIAARVATEQHRERARRPTPLADAPDPSLRRDDTVADDGVLWQRVRALPARQRTAVALHYILRLPHKEVAAVLGTTSAATRRLVSDALVALRKDPQLKEC